MLDNTDTQLAKILEAIQNVGVGKYGEFIATKMQLTLYTDAAIMVISGIVAALLAVYSLNSANDDGARALTCMACMVSAVIFIVCLSSLPGDFAAVKHPEGAVAQEILSALKSK